MINKKITINTDLRELYNKCNEKYFNNSLPENIGLKYDGRLSRSAGLCYIKKNKHSAEAYKISLNKAYHKKYEDEILNTLIHEMIHVLHPKDKHGTKFNK